VRIKVKILRSNARLPKRATLGSVGYDIYAAIDSSLTISPKETVLIPSGFSISLKNGYAAFIFARSGLGVKHNIALANGVGVIDSDYRNEVFVGLTNNSNTTFTIRPLDRIAQMIIMKCGLPSLKLCMELPSSTRVGGFGSTGLAD
jgi:dUTP pyrophosphatase